MLLLRKIRDAIAVLDNYTFLHNHFRLFCRVSINWAIISHKLLLLDQTNMVEILIALKRN